MREKIDTPVSVSLHFNHKTRQVAPTNIIWENRGYQVDQVGLHHTYHTGKTLFHVFSVTAGASFFKLVLNSDTLHWRLEEVSDGLPD